MENPTRFVFFKGVPLLPLFHDVEYIQKMQDEFELQDEDVVIVTYPKSGTHWMIHILSLIYSKGDPTWVKSVPYWKRSPWIETKIKKEMLENKENSHLFTSHLPVHLFPKSFFTSKAKILYVARNPRDVLVSLYHFKNHIPSYRLYSSFEHFFEEFLQGNVPLGSWFDHIKGWLSMRNSEKFLFLTYEELHQNLKDSVEKLCQFLGKELSEEEINSVMKNASFQVMKKHILENKEPMPIENMESIKIVLMRKGICGDWKNHFTVTQMETFNKLYQEKMKGMDQDLFSWDQC
ncbi:sulfotransferase 2A1-like [Antechinus flavipes]|uniref:sulfotransferase 2A1-like n=1 Tax=Antechinus flavipes TaxID=38775 RepID=UPI0022355F76|nr:sulfotransferase 2A1-like [Antechinus flavipes]